MTQLVNLTGHKLTLTDGTTIVVVPSEGRARVVSQSRIVERLVLEELARPLPITMLYDGKVVNLPEAEPGTLYVVSGLVAAATPSRLDVVAPGRLLRDSESGRVIGAQGFVKSEQAA